MAAPACSVVIPAYNAAAHVAAAVESVLAQAGGHLLEVIAIDDGSTDATGEVLAGFGDAISVLSQPNRGPGAARNAGVRMSRAGLVAFLDADDLALPGRFARQIDHMRASPETAVCFGNWIVEGEPGDYLARYGLVAAEDGFVAVARPFDRLMTAGSFVPTSTAMLRREAYLAAGMPEDRRYAEDHTLWCRIALAGGRFDFTRLPLSWYRTSAPGRLTFSPHTHEGRVRLFAEMLSSHAALLSPEALPVARARFAAAADGFLRRLWATAGREAVLAEIDRLSPLLPPATARKWRALSLVPSVLPRIARRGIALFDPA